MTHDEIIQKIQNDPDFINVRRFGFSLKKIMEKYPDGVPNRLIANALSITEEEVEANYTEIAAKLRDLLTDDEDI